MDITYISLNSDYWWIVKEECSYVCMYVCAKYARCVGSS